MYKLAQNNQWSEVRLAALAGTNKPLEFPFEPTQTPFANDVTGSGVAQ